MNFLRITARKDAFSLPGLLAVAVVLGLCAWLLLPLYFARIEEARALSMQAMLINVSIAQEAYRAQHQAYTDDWAALMPFLARPASLQVSVQKTDSPREYFFGFGPGAAKKQDGFRVLLSLKESGQSGSVSAQRTGGAPYGLLRAFPDGETQCHSAKKSGEVFCERFTQSSQSLELKNLVAVPATPETK